MSEWTDNLTDYLMGNASARQTTAVEQGLTRETLSQVQFYAGAVHDTQQALKRQVAAFVMLVAPKPERQVTE